MRIVETTCEIYLSCQAGWVRIGGKHQTSSCGCSNTAQAYHFGGAWSCQIRNVTWWVEQRETEGKQEEKNRE